MTDYEIDNLRSYARSLNDAERAVMLDVLLEDPSALLRCPCCGGTAGFSATGGGRIICAECGLSTADYVSSEAAKNAWNQRV